MDLLANAALSSWAFHPGTLFVLVAFAGLYIRGWTVRRRLLQYPSDGPRLAAFLAGLALVFLALESPLDTFDTMFLSAHMTQHLLLMMLAPPLVLLGKPVIPLLRGLPKPWVREALGPFLTWRPLQVVSEWLTAAPVAWTVFALSTVIWHLPATYELAVRSPACHEVQHACFFWSGILFWWPIIRQSPAPSKWPSWIAVPYLLFADIVNTVIGAIFVFSGHLLYPSYEASRVGTLSAQDDQTIAGLIMWVPGSIIYLLPAFVFGMRLLSKPRSEVELPQRVRRSVPAPSRRQATAPAGRMGVAVFRRSAQFAMLLIAVAITIDGWFGPQAGPLNLAGVLPWIHWRALSIAALLLVGNLFCMACPFTLARDGWRKLLPPKLRWPRALRNKWVAAALFVLYLWAYEAFGLWDSPWLTAWIIAGYFAAAIVIDGLFKGATFCKYVCPIGQFHFLTSLASPAEIRVRSSSVCRSCQTYDCIRGNQKARGCELNLFQPKKSGNLDCTFCLDCVQACPHDNVALLPVLPAKTILAVETPRSSLGKLSKRTDFAALALIFVFGAFTNAAGMVAPVMTVEHHWHSRLGAHALPWIVAAFVLTGVILIPFLVTALCATLNRWQAGRELEGGSWRKLAFAAVPLGVGMWSAHLLFHLATSWQAAVPVVQRFLTGTVSSVATVTSPAWLTNAQLLLLDAGLLTALYLAWRLFASAHRTWRAIALLAPWALAFTALYVAGVWILFEPMQMRGMVMN